MYSRWYLLKSILTNSKIQIGGNFEKLNKPTKTRCWGRLVCWKAVGWVSPKIWVGELEKAGIVSMIMSILIITIIMITVWLFATYFRQELRKFMRETKKTNPAAQCSLQGDKLYIDHKYHRFRSWSEWCLNYKLFICRGTSSIMIISIIDLDQGLSKALNASFYWSQMKEGRCGWRAESSMKTWNLNCFWSNDNLQQHWCFTVSLFPWSRCYVWSDTQAKVVEHTLVNSKIDLIFNWFSPLPL